jgi:Casein kinase II regulatory subunit
MPAKRGTIGAHYHEALPAVAFPFLDRITSANALHNYRFYTKTKTRQSPDDPSDIQRFWTLIGKVITQHQQRTDRKKAKKAHSDFPNIIAENLADLKERRLSIPKSGDIFATLIEDLDAIRRAQDPNLKLPYLITWPCPFPCSASPSRRGRRVIHTATHIFLVRNSTQASTKIRAAIVERGNRHDLEVLQAARTGRSWPVVCVFTDMSSSSGTPESWISSFCSLLGHEYFAEISEDFIEDDFNLTGLQTQVAMYKEALEVNSLPYATIHIANASVR